MILAIVWFTLLMLLSFGIAYTSFAEIRSDGDLPGSPISVVPSAMAILITWDEIGGGVVKTVFWLFLPHGSGSSIAFITAASVSALALLSALFAPHICAFFLWQSAANHRRLAK